MLNIYRRFILMLICTGFAIPATAAETDIQWLPKAVHGGFTVKLPSIDNDMLLDEIISLKIALMQDNKLLSQQVEQKRFKNKDTVLAALLPGGLIYAAYKKNIYAQAVQNYELNASLVEELTTDIAALTVSDGPILVAQAR